MTNMRIFHTVFVLLAVLFIKSQFNAQGIKDPKQFIKFNSSFRRVSPASDAICSPITSSDLEDLYLKMLIEPRDSKRGLL